MRPNRNTAYIVSKRWMWSPKPTLTIISDKILTLTQGIPYPSDGCGALTLP